MKPKLLLYRHFDITIMTVNANPMLKDVIHEFEHELRLDKVKNALVGKTIRQKAYFSLVLRNYYEVLSILKRILEEKVRMAESQRHLTSPDADADQDDAADAMMEATLLIMPALVLDIKCLYIWCHQICSIFYRLKVEFDLAELRRISLIRNKFLTHIAETPLFQSSISTQMGVRADKDWENIQILFYTPDLSREKGLAINKLVEGLKGQIVDLGQEKNLYEQIGIIYRNLHRIRDQKLRRAAADVIQTVGVASEPPALIAKELLVALRHFIREFSTERVEQIPARATKTGFEL